MRIPFVGWVSQLPVVGVSIERKVSQMLTSEVLNRAADLIEERGWADGDDPEMWGDGAAGTGTLCLEGGILAAQGKSEVPFASEHHMNACPAYRAVHSYLLTSDRLPGPTSRVYQFNDAPDRTASEVIEVLRAAAAIEQARESQRSVVSS